MPSLQPKLSQILMELVAFVESNKKEIKAIQCDPSLPPHKRSYCINDIWNAIGNLEDALYEMNADDERKNATPTNEYYTSSRFNYRVYFKGEAT